MAPTQATVDVSAAADGSMEIEKGKAVQQENVAERTDASLNYPANSDTESSIWKILKENPRIIAYSVFANTGPLLFGYDILVTGACVALPAFSISYGELYNGQLILPAVWQSLWNAFVQIGVMMGAFVNGFIQDRFGRKVSYLVGGLITVIGSIFAYLSPDVGSLLGRRLMFFFAKFITGWGMGILMSTCQTYISEISPPRIRGVLLGFFALIVSVGQMIAVTLVFSRIAIIDPSAFKFPFAIQWIFSGLSIITAFVIPESPTYLITKGFRTKAEKAYRRLHGSQANVTVGLQILQNTVDHERSIQATGEGATYAECFKGINARRTRIILLVTTLQQFLGVSLLANSSYFLIMAGMSPSGSLQISQIGIGLGIAGTFISWFTMTWLGRRFLILASCGAVGVVFIGMGIAGFYTHSKSALTFVGAAILLVGVLSALGVGSVWPVVASETSSLRLRAKSSGIGFLTNALGGGTFTIVVPYLFNADAANMGAKIGFVFAGFCLLGFVLSWFVIPETKDKTYEELDYLFERGTRTRDFKKQLPRLEGELKGEN